MNESKSRKKIKFGGQINVNVGWKKRERKWETRDGMNWRKGTKGISLDLVKFDDMGR